MVGCRRPQVALLTAQGRSAARGSDGQPASYAERFSKTGLEAEIREIEREIALVAAELSNVMSAN